MKTFPLLLPGVLLLLTSLAADAQRTAGQFDPFEGDGYYWYKRDPEAQLPKKPASAPKPVDPKPVKEKPTEQKPLSVAWLKANMPILLDKAIENPTRENDANYMYAQRVVLDKSQTFSDMAADVVASDGYLDENNRVPLSSYAQNAFILEKSSNETSVMKYLAGKSGIWVFVDKPDKCRACADYVNNIVTSNIVGLEAVYGFHVRLIDVSTPEGSMAAKKLNLKLTPTTVLVVPPSSYYLVSQGLMSATSLQQKILVSARMNGMLKDEMIEKINPYSKGLIAKGTLDSAEFNDDPSVVMSKFREQLTGVK